LYGLYCQAVYEGKLRLVLYSPVFNDPYYTVLLISVCVCVIYLFLEMKVKKLLVVLSIVSACICAFALYNFAYPDSRLTANTAINNNPIQSNNDVHKSSREIKSDKQFSDATQQHSRGFVIAGDYFEQQLGAAMNMLTLSKWAKSIGVSPVEPYVRESVFYFPGSFKPKRSMLRFRDYFDIDYWNEKCLEHNAMPLVSVDTFMAHKPKNLILVKIIGNKNIVLPKVAYVNDEIANEPMCNKSISALEVKSNVHAVKELGMKIVRDVCMSFMKHKALHVQDFNEIIYGQFDPANTVVWFRTWEGIFEVQRIKIIEKEYHRNSEVFDMLRTSHRIIDDSKRYVRNILKSSFGNYIGISFRSIKRSKAFYVDHLKGQMDFFHTCIQRLEHTVSVLHNDSNPVFLALDLGKFGDNKASKYLTRKMMSDIENELFQALYKDTLTMNKWEHTFVNITNGITDSGYIATLQSTILKNSGCLVMFGGDSNFQRFLLSDFQKNFPNPCFREVCYIY